VHFGVILPNYGLDSNPDGIRRTAELAEELGFDSVWATEHIIVGPEAVDPYGRVCAPLVTVAGSPSGRSGSGSARRSCSYRWPARYQLEPCLSHHPGQCVICLPEL